MNREREREIRKFLQTHKYWIYATYIFSSIRFYTSNIMHQIILYYIIHTLLKAYVSYLEKKNRFSYFFSFSCILFFLIGWYIAHTYLVHKLFVVYTKYRDTTMYLTRHKILEWKSFTCLTNIHAHSPYWIFFGF